MSRGYLVILRGVPGSGKSTYAQRFVRKMFGLRFCLSSHTASADSYFIRPDKVYDWNPKLLPNAHQWVYEKVKEDMETDDVWQEAELIVLDNTNIRKKDYARYIELAEKNDYKVKVIVVGSTDESMAEEYFKRNIHKVPLQTIERMLYNFEK